MTQNKAYLIKEDEFHSNRLKAYLESSNLLTDTGRETIEDFKSGNYSDAEIGIISDDGLYVNLIRHSHDEISVDLYKDNSSEAMGHCRHAGKLQPHYSWFVDNQLRGRNLGGLIRTIKENIDGTLQYEHARKKSLALPLVGWGYVPIARSTGNLEEDIAGKHNTDELKSLFGGTDDYFDESIWLEYNPIRAHDFLKEIEDMNYE